MKNRLIIATRRSELAMWQANHVASLLRQVHSDLEIELLPMQTQGDRILDKALASIGGKGLFLKELEVALLDGKADIAVHSMKDVPVIPTPELSVDIVLERANPFDALLSLHGESLADLAPGSRIGTSSLRRQCQVLSHRPDCKVIDLRGNVNSRIQKLQEGQYEAIILACAGLERLRLDHLITEKLQPPKWLPAVTQGTICIQYRTADEELKGRLLPLNHSKTSVDASAERLVSKRLGGSCHTPLAVFCRQQADDMLIEALVGTADGQQILRSSRSGSYTEAEQLSHQVADDLLNQGAAKIISSVS
jgi:hydroxymethylbilane synthase